MLLRRVQHDPLAQSGYLIACQEAREAIVVDPVRDPEPYLEAAREEGVRITMVTETHVHADFVSGAPALASAAGAALLLSGKGHGPARGPEPVGLLAGLTDVSNVAGGYGAWRAAGFHPTMDDA